MSKEVRYTIDAVDITMLDSKQKELIEKLNFSLVMSDKDPESSIMHYGQLCNCDDGYLCEHRLQVIVDYLKQ